MNAVCVCTCPKANKEKNKNREAHSGVWLQVGNSQVPQ